MRLTEYILLAASSLFVIVDPLACVPAFLAMTRDDDERHRSRTAGLACVVVAIVLVGFAAVGKWIFRFLGITMPAFQIASSILLLLVALDMLRAQRSRVQETTEETEAGVSKDEIAITPLAVPMLAGPGAISMAVTLQAQAADLYQTIALYGCIIGVSVASYVVLRLSASGARWLSPIALKIATRIMGLLLAAIAIQFSLTALTTLRNEWFPPAH